MGNKPESSNVFLLMQSAGLKETKSDTSYGCSAMIWLSLCEKGLVNNLYVIFYASEIFILWNLTMLHVKSYILYENQNHT